MANAQPQLSPNDPAYKAQRLQEANEQQINQLLIGALKVSEYVEAPPKYEDAPRHPYLAWGGKKKNEYTVSYKNVSYIIKATSLLDAVEQGYMKMVEKMINFMKNNVKLGVQRRNKRRDNHIYYFLVKKEKIKNPNYKYKITFTKIKNNS